MDGRKTHDSSVMVHHAQSLGIGHNVDMGPITMTIEIAGVPVKLKVFVAIAHMSREAHFTLRRSLRRVFSDNAITHAVTESPTELSNKGTP